MSGRPIREIIDNLSADERILFNYYIGNIIFALPVVAKLVGHVNPLGTAADYLRWTSNSKTRAEQLKQFAIEYVHNWANTCRLHSMQWPLEDLLSKWHCGDEAENKAVEGI